MAKLLCSHDVSCDLIKLAFELESSTKLIYQQRTKHTFVHHHIRPLLVLGLLLLRKKMKSVNTIRPKLLAYQRRRWLSFGSLPWFRTGLGPTSWDRSYVWQWRRPCLHVYRVPLLHTPEVLYSLLIRKSVCVRWLHYQRVGGSTPPILLPWLNFANFFIEFFNRNVLRLYQANKKVLGGIYLKNRLQFLNIFIYIFT